MRVLVVDDQKELLDRIGGMLKGTGHTVTLETNSRRALELISLHPFDALVTDIVMPELGGIDLIRSVRADHPALRIVAISGGGDVVPTHTALTISEAFGADRILYKPFRKAELLIAIEPD